MRRSIRFGGLAAACALLLSGCGFTGIYDIPLPGGADLGDHPITLKAQFKDVLDLVPQAGVKVNNVAVGRVEDIRLAPDGWTAEVTVEINGDVELPSNALANVRQSSLLGEKYVELSNPGDTASKTRLADGAVIPLARTDRDVEVEEVLGALSMLLNGGGVEQLNTITKELNQATSGNEANIRSLLDNANELVTALDEQSGNITRALDGLNRLSSTLNDQRDKIANAVDNLGPGLGVLEQQRGQLVRMLQALQSLSGVAVDTINRSQADLVADLRALQPTLQKLGEAGSNLPKALELLLTFPFTDTAMDDIKGDYFNLYADVDLDLTTVLENLGRSRQNVLQDALPKNLSGGTSGTQQQQASPLPLPLSTPAPLNQLPDLGSLVPGLGTQSTATTGPAGIFNVLSGGGS